MHLQLCIILVGLTLSGIVQTGVPRPANAIPAMSRQTGEPCATCHDVVPKLNHAGQTFRANGFRFLAPNIQETAQDLKSRPRSTELGIDAKPEPPDRSLEERQEEDAR